MKRLLLTFCIPTLTVFSLQAQLLLTQQTPEFLTLNTLTGNGVTVTNITFNGQPANLNSTQVAFFNGVGTNIGLDSGLVLATGNYNIAVGPNNQGGAGNGVQNGTINDPDLMQISSQPNVNDCAILEFDFVPIGDTVRFRYVFGSEEYDEYVCSGFNDVFGFFISGPGINGPFTNNAENIALVPGTSTPVAINTINLGVPGSNGIASNCAAIDPNWTSYNVYYTSNAGGTTIQYDGFTKVLEAVSAVQCNQTYHLKIAIADAVDDAFDSGVFLEASSLTSVGINISALTTSGDSLLVEGCNSALLIIDRPQADSALSFPVSISGTATNGVDINNIPSQIVLPVGVFSDTLVIQPFFDGLPEGVESITFSIVYPTPCGPDSVFATLYIQDIDSLHVDALQDTLICTATGQTAPLTTVVTGGAGGYTYLWSTAETDSAITVAPPLTQTYVVVVTDTCGNTASDSVLVTVRCPILIPNIFSPNGDGPNDFFQVLNIEQYPGNEVIIYSRWGNIIHRATNYQNDWDGGNHPEGVYFYVVDNKIDEPQAGFFQLVR